MEKNRIEKNKRTAYVYHLIHVRTPYRRIAKLFIKNVPDAVSDSELKELINRNFNFGEFGIPWGNHYIERGLKSADSEIVRAYKNEEAQIVTFEELEKMAEVED